MRKTALKILALTAVISVLFSMTSCNSLSKETSMITSISESSIETTETTVVTETETETETETIPETETETETETEAETSETTTAATTAAATKKATPKPAAKPKNLSPKWVRDLSQAKNKKNTQLVIVAADGMSKSTAKVSMHERDKNGNWIQVFSVKGLVGRYGMIADKDRKEGCKKTPIGVYTFNKAFGIAKDPGCAIPYTKVTKDLYWSGDQRKGMQYNKMVSIKDYPKLDTKNSEHLIDYTKPYQYCLNISFNKECKLGKGSAIFLHCTGNTKYTSGCVSIPKSYMLKVMKRVKPGCVVIINTASKLKAK
ncbi:MAG: L,D-transpeptidase family protein [Oscillospiraceae bacterium]|nr:L,D-transpeptidase family protein [Oscillospiraceae bacterium]